MAAGHICLRDHDNMYEEPQSLKVHANNFLHNSFQLAELMPSGMCSDDGADM